MRRLAVCLLGLLLLAACSVDIPSNVISRHKMERILYDYHVAQGMADCSEGDRDAERYRLVRLVFEKHGVTEAEFDSSMVWYSAHAAHLTEMYKNIDKRMQKELTDLGGEELLVAQYDRYADTGDTAAVWRRHMVCVHHEEGRNILTFTLAADSTFHRGDILQVRFSNRFVSPRGRHEAYAFLAARYDNDSVQGQTARVVADHDVMLTLPASSLAREHDLRSVTLTFYQEPAADDEFCLWLIRHPFLLRIHTAEPEQPADTLATDTVTFDSLQADTLAPDTQTIIQIHAPEERLSPTPAPRRPHGFASRRL